MILIAEDEQVFKELYSLLLNKMGIPFALAENGEEAVKMALSDEPDLVLLDIQMPVMNGYEAAKKMRKHGFNKPIVAVTASDSLEEWEFCFESGIDDLLRKPIKSTELKNMIDKWMDTEEETAPAEKKETSTLQYVVFHGDTLLDTFLNNEEMALSLLSRFIARTQDQINTLPDLQKDKKWEDARQIVHMIKGAANTMSGSDLGKAASRLEMAYKNQDTEEIAAAFSPLKDAFELFKKEAEDFIELRS